VNYAETKSLPKILVNFKSSEFEELFIEAIDQTLSNLGLGVKQAFYSFLEVHYTLSKEDVPNRIGDFVDGMEKIFGTSASLLEVEVMKSLRRKVPSFIYLVESPYLLFEDYSESLRRHIENL